MATNVRKKSKPLSLGTEQMEFLVTHAVLDEPGVEAHSGGIKKLSKKVDEVKDEMEHMMKKLNYIFQQAEKTQSGSQYVLDEITIGMGFSASGGIAFIAEAGVEASLEFKFKRK